MNTNEIQLLQGVQMRIMDEIHRICINNNLRYYLIGGSAIGAKRHKGIIPWDLDIDMAMPRPDYQKFIDVFPDQCSSCFRLEYYKTKHDFQSPHILVYLNDSEILYKNDAYNHWNGIYVDVLPLDQCPNSNALRWIQAKEIRLTWKIIKYSSLIIEPEDGLIKKTVKKMLSALFGLFSRDYINRKQEKIMMRYDDRKNCTSWCSMASHYTYKKLCMPKEYFGQPQLAEFSGRKYCVPEMLEDYLTHLFGDYNKLPSEERRNAQINMIKCASWYDERGEKITVGEK